MQLNGCRKTVVFIFALALPAYFAAALLFAGPDDLESPAAPTGESSSELDGIELTSVSDCESGSGFIGCALGQASGLHAEILKWKDSLQSEYNVLHQQLRQAEAAAAEAARASGVRCNSTACRQAREQIRRRRPAVQATRRAHGNAQGLINQIDQKGTYYRLNSERMSSGDLMSFELEVSELVGRVCSQLLDVKRAFQRASLPDPEGTGGSPSCHGSSDELETPDAAIEPLP
ncbi:MAG: hypothetical protein HYT79_10835 [Elusimicrobia bacterium]|nr:hypothetical protein [Elusimicrobiota bacterium]